MDIGCFVDTPAETPQHGELRDYLAAETDSSHPMRQPWLFGMAMFLAVAVWKWMSVTAL